MELGGWNFNTGETAQNLGDCANRQWSRGFCKTSHPQNDGVYRSQYPLKFGLSVGAAGLSVRPHLKLLIQSVMSDENKNQTPASDLLKNSSLYREFQAEREEILKHKWIESEKAGHDIGFERALLDWIRKHRDNWRASRRAQTDTERRAG